MRPNFVNLENTGVLNLRCTLVSVLRPICPRCNTNVPARFSYVLAKFEAVQASVLQPGKCLQQTLRGWSFLSLLVG